MKKIIFLVVFAVSFLFLGTEVAAGAGSRAAALQWVYQQEGKKLDWDGYPASNPYQCVDLIKYYYNYFGVAEYARGNGCDYTSNALPPGWQRIQNYAEFVPEPGDIAVWTDAGWKNGHVAIILSADVHSFVSMDQNWPQGSEIKRVTHTYKYFYGVIRPNWDSASNNKDPRGWLDGATGGEGTINVRGWAIDDDTPDQAVEIHIYADGPAGEGTCIASGIIAGNDSTDVGRHRFDATFATDLRGEHKIYAYAINTKTGNNPVLSGCPKTVSISSPDPDVGQEMISGYEREIPDGDYLIVSAGSPDKQIHYFLDILGTDCPAASGTNVSLQESSADPASFDVWHLTYSDGFYTITQKGSGDTVALDLYGASLKNKANVVAHAANGSSAQKWAIWRNNRDGYRIQAKCSGLSLDVADGNFTSGANIQQHISNDSLAQSWLFIPYQPEQTLQNGKYIVLSDVDNHFELDVPGDTGDVADQTVVQLWDDGAKSEYNAFEFTKLDNGYYKVIHVASGKALEVYGGGSDPNDTSISLYEWNGSIAQQWAITKDGANGGYVLRVRSSGYAIDLANALTENRALVRQFYYNGTPAETWKFVSAKYALDVNGWTDNSPKGNVTGYATFDVYLDGTRVADNVGDYCEQVPYNSTYEIKDIRVADGKSLEGYSDYTRDGYIRGGHVGNVKANTDARLILNTINASAWINNHASSNVSAYNGHSYYFYDSPATWYEAKVICEQLGGHLVTITSADENAFVKGMIGDDRCWIGGTDKESEGVWKWVTGEAFSYKNWDDGQPDNNTGGIDGSENFAHIWENSSTWNDYSGEEKMPFVCEVDVAYQVTYDCNGGDGSIEPTIKAVGQSIMITDKVPSRSGYAFKGWAKTKTATAAQFTAGAVYSADADIILYAVWKKLEPDFIVPASLITIEEEAFINCSFTYVKLSESTTVIGNRAFANCKNLSNIYIPEATTTIAADAFEGVPDGLTIHGKENSQAEYYAWKHGYTFVKE